MATMQQRQSPAIPKGTILAIVALVAAVFLPLLVGLGQGGQEQTTVLLADLDQRRNPKLVAALEEATAEGRGRDTVLVVIDSPRRNTCSTEAKTPLCMTLARFEHQVTVVRQTTDVEPAMIVDSLYGKGPKPEGANGLFTTTRSTGSSFSLAAAFLTGLSILGLATVGLLLAPALVIWWAARHGQRNGPQRTAVPLNAHPGHPHQPQRHPTPVPRESAAPQRQRRFAASPSGPASNSLFDPPPAPAPRHSGPGTSAPSTSRPRRGDEVVARTHFGPDGGYVDVDGLIVWAVLEPAGIGALPGQPLQVVDRGHPDPLTVSPIHR
ncbi:hypothetical protein [Phytohabitans houttuyneae]|uniref:hypothetical protein n=1 Tax=Phytohabitans houttuyneae TaxID=1076126 RepID=UPI001C49C1C6|nr:hypothetical protein [Phytohabitans houttuyneae]